MNRRTLLTTLASLPLLGWVKPKATIVSPIYRFASVDCNPHRKSWFVSIDGGKTWERGDDPWIGNGCRSLSQVRREMGGDGPEEL
jgi:hypothetical protein